MSYIVVDADSITISAARLAKADRALGRVHQKLGPPPLWKRPASFATLVRIILEQQVSLASAKSTFTKLKAECGGRVTAGGIENLGDDRLRELGFSRQKSRYTSALAEDVLAKRFKIGSLRHQDDETVRDQITARLGLGNWSADVFLLMALCRTDILPVGDLALVKGMGQIDHCTYTTTEEILQRAEAWRPYRSIATRMVWQHYLAQGRQQV